MNPDADLGDLGSSTSSMHIRVQNVHRKQCSMGTIIAILVTEDRNTLIEQSAYHIQYFVSQSNNQLTEECEGSKLTLATCKLSCFLPREKSTRLIDWCYSTSSSSSRKTPWNYSSNYSYSFTSVAMACLYTATSHVHAQIRNCIVHIYHGPFQFC